MAARTSPQAKRGTRQAAKPAAKKSVAQAPAKPGSRKKAPAKAAAKKPGSKAPQSKAKNKAAGADAASENQMLAEQNAALRAELELSNARIARLEALHADVVDRIDWVIDSLQTVLEEKR